MGEEHANPFAEPEDSNPFADSSIISSLTNQVSYTPLHDDSSTTVEMDLSTSTRGQPQGKSKAELDLAAREADLLSRENALNQRAQLLDNANVKIPNWPFFYPVIFLSIEEEIPEGNKKTMIKMYQFWLVCFDCL
jgi:hypothetical protein